jgi:hypothetical protein
MRTIYQLISKLRQCLSALKHMLDVEEYRHLGTITAGIIVICFQMKQMN